jgi:hypothetical protein
MSKISNLEDAIKLKKIKQKYINQKEKLELDILMLQRELEVIEQQLEECNVSDSGDIKQIYEKYMKNEYFKKKFWNIDDNKDD